MTHRGTLCKPKPQANCGLQRTVPAKFKRETTHLHFQRENAHHNRRSEAEVSVSPVLAGQACPLAGMAPKERAKARAAHFGSWESTTLDFRLPASNPTHGSHLRESQNRVFFRKASHPLKKSSPTRVPTAHHPEPGNHSPQIPAGLCGCICRCNYKHKQKIECILLELKLKSNAFWD